LALDVPTAKEVDSGQSARSDGQAMLESLHDAQRSRVTHMLRVSDVKVGLAWLLSRTTERAMGAMHQGDFKHPLWLADVLLRLDAIFEAALQENYTSATSVIESHWQRVFHCVDSNHGNPETRFCSALDAWIMEDMPRALATTYLNQYKEICDFARFRSDYFALISVFLEAANETSQLFPGKTNNEFSKSATELTKLLPTTKSTGTKYFAHYPVSEWNAIFDRGARIVHLVQEQHSPASKVEARVASLQRLVNYAQHR
jgi:hypothetical protein